MSNWHTEDPPTPTGTNTGGYLIVAAIIALGLFCIIGIGVIKPLSDNAAAEAQSRAFAIAEQSKAQIQAERERTERTAQEQQTARESARNRADIITSGLIIIGATLAFGLVIAAGVGLVYGIERVSMIAADRRAEAQEQHHQRLLIYAAQIRQLELEQSAAPLAIPARRRPETILIQEPTA